MEKEDDLPVEMNKADLKFFNSVLTGNAKIVENHKSRSKLFKLVSGYAESISIDEDLDAWLIHLGDGDFVVYRKDKSWVYDNGYKYTSGVKRLRELPRYL